MTGAEPEPNEQIMRTIAGLSYSAPPTERRCAGRGENVQTVNLVAKRRSAGWAGGTLPPASRPARRPRMSEVKAL